MTKELDSTLHFALDNTGLNFLGSISIQKLSQTLQNYHMIRNQFLGPGFYILHRFRYLSWLYLPYVFQGCLRPRLVFKRMRKKENQTSGEEH